MRRDEYATARATWACALVLWACVAGSCAGQHVRREDLVIYPNPRVCKPDTVAIYRTGGQ